MLRSTPTFTKQKKIYSIALMSMILLYM
uniref:Uncharacterized protein n=1 Tax=Anguilla anguilla TaxID=7936 RepID=A0A0E9VTL7_ANGAN